MSAAGGGEQLDSRTDLLIMLSIWASSRRQTQRRRWKDKSCQREHSGAHVGGVICAHHYTAKMFFLKCACEHERCQCAHRRRRLRRRRFLTHYNISTSSLAAAYRARCWSAGSSHIGADAALKRIKVQRVVVAAAAAATLAAAAIGARFFGLRWHR